VRYDPTLFDLVQDLLGEVAGMQLEGEDRENGLELEDVNLISGEWRIGLDYGLLLQPLAGERKEPR
jgi:hypothetical protein